MAYSQKSSPSQPNQENLGGDLFYENLADKRQLAEKLAVSQSYIDKLMTQGLPRYKIGRAVRFRFSEVMEWLQKRRFP